MKNYYLTDICDPLSQKGPLIGILVFTVLPKKGVLDALRRFSDLTLFATKDCTESIYHFCQHETNCYMVQTDENWKQLVVVPQ